MILKREAAAGTEEKSDARITAAPGTGRDIRLLKLPHPRFAEHVRALVNEALDERGIENAAVTVEDFGALDFVLRARLTTALRAAGEEEKA